MSRDTALVTADWVQEHLDDPDVVLIEVDEDTESYDKGHIRGAIKIDWTKDLKDGVRHDFISKERLEQLLSERGVSNDHTLVFYGGPNTWFAAYADPDNAGPAAVRASGRLAYPSGNRAVTALGHLYRDARHRARRGR